MDEGMDEVESGWKGIGNEIDVYKYDYNHIYVIRKLGMSERW